MSLLETTFLHLTSPSEEKIHLRADLIGARVENTRGTTDVWTLLMEDGTSKVFTVMETPKEITEAMAKAYEYAKKQEREETRRKK